MGSHSGCGGNPSRLSSLVAWEHGFVTPPTRSITHPAVHEYAEMRIIMR